MAVGTHDEGGSEEPLNRQPENADLTRLCADFNARGVRYVVVGGFAIIQAGFPRLTQDIDFLIETTVENETLAFEALKSLPDKASAELVPGDVAEYGVVRVSDEIMVDLMKSGCGVTYADAIKDAVWRELDGVRIPFASKPTLWKMKQTVREKDIPDRLFLRQQLEAEGIPLDPPPKEIPRDVELPRWLEWLERRFGKPRR